jgi:3-hydroxymyristoyl/3-hydroxydecanoyl-(acyl carrier protein) dehydratase
VRYVLVDRITEFQSGRILRGIKNVTMSDDLMKTYQTGEGRQSLLPATMILEGLAQAAGILVAGSIDCNAQPVLAKVQPFTTYGVARAGDQINLYAELEELRLEGARARTLAEVDGRKLAEATIYLALMSFEADAVTTRRQILRAHMAALFPEWFGERAKIEVPG